MSLPMGIALGLAFLVGGPSEALGQVTGSTIVQLVQDRELEYQAALSEYTAAYDAWEVLQRRWDQLMRDQSEARNQGDDDLWESIVADAQELSGQMNQAETRLQDLRDEWRASGTALVSALDAHLDLLTVQAQTAQSDDQPDLATLYRDRDNRLRTVERELGPTRALELRPLPEITIGPRDSPRDILFKAQLLTRKVEQHETLISDVNGEIEDLQRRQRRSRVFGDFLAGVERYDDIQVPVTSETTRSQLPEEELAAAADSVQTVPRSIEDRIQDLLTFRGALELRRDQLREKADSFLERAGGTWSGWGMA